MAYWTYYHQLDPFLIQFTQYFGIRWYSLAYIAGVIAAYYLAYYFIKKDRLFLPESQVLDIVTYGAIGAIAGGRIGYCVFYAPHLLTSFDSSFPMWGLLKIHQGGMSSHGGILGLVLSQVWYAYSRKISFLSLMDLAALSGSVGIFMGRIANFINGELYGRAIQGKAFVGVKFPSELFLWVKQPENYKEQILGLKSILEPLQSLGISKLPSSYTWNIWLEELAAGQDKYQAYVSQIFYWITENSDHPTIRTILESLLTLRHPSQFYQAFFEGMLPFIVIAILWRKPRPAGMIGVLWAFMYCIGRVFTEFFRLPDPEIGFQLLGLTRGQWLSIFVLILLTPVYWYFFHNKSNETSK